MEISKDQCPHDIRQAARSEAIRTLAHNSVTSMAYDGLADMAVKVARMCNPAIDACDMLDAPESFMRPDANIDGRYLHRQRMIPVGDLIDDLWSEDRIAEIGEKLLRLSSKKTETSAELKIIRNTFRGHLVCDLQNDDYIMIVSAIVKVVP